MTIDHWGSIFLTKTQVSNHRESQEITCKSTGIHHRSKKRFSSSKRKKENVGKEIICFPRGGNYFQNRCDMMLDFVCRFGKRI